MTSLISALGLELTIKFFVVRVAVSLFQIVLFEAMYTLLLGSSHVSNSPKGKTDRKSNHVKGLTHAKMCLNQN